MTVSSPTLLKDLQKQVGALEADLRQQVEALPELGSSLRSEHAAATKAGRTAESWTAWLDAQITQAAVAWVLACVFVRFCEDNDLTDRRWLAGIADAHGDGLSRALDAQAAWIQANPRENDRGWLREAFGWLRSTRAGAALVDEHNPVWRWDISADAAAALLAFFRRRDADGVLAHTFDQRAADGVLDTRFLGDLYQDLSEAARKRYALLQTPEFVEEFILDLTLTPALEEFGLDGLRLIDPTCGSGHFLLGAFYRLLDAWSTQGPGLDLRERVQKALDSVHGVDVNPFATAIAKFRLVVAALSAEGLTRLDTAPAYRLHVGTGDSLLWEQGRQGELMFGESGLSEHQYATEDLHDHPDILNPGRYHVVVGNPPYITVKDKALNEAYRRAYKTCHRQYALSVPFAELFFRLAHRGDETQSAGYVGQITSNSFMKREFGSKLIEEFFPTVDLTHVIDTSGAYIPGHGTPTVVLVGRRRHPKTDSLRAVLGVRGEPSAPADPAKGLVWASIANHLDQPGTTTEFVTVADLPRTTLSAHPWSLSGGGAVEVAALLDSAAVSRMTKSVEEIGFAVITGEDDAFVAPGRRFRSIGVNSSRPFGTGDIVRDFDVHAGERVIWPYDEELALQPLAVGSSTWRFLWPYRRNLQVRKRFGTPVETIRGFTWYEYREFYRNRFKTALSIVFAFVATHNHFVLDRGGKVFNRSAPVIKLPARASEDDHLRLIGLLNSSTACFWLKQVSHGKGNGGVNEGYRGDEWEEFFEFTGTKLQEFPLPAGAPLDRARSLDGLAQELGRVTPSAACTDGVATRLQLAEARATYERIRGEMVALQEELDWEVYRLYGILDEDLTCEPSDVPPLKLGERAFEIVLARKVAAGEEQTAWFERHRSTPITEVPAHWPAAYRDLVERRIKTIEEHPLLHLIERPECKRRWASPTWEQMQDDALRDWVLDRLEAETLWSDGSGPRVLSVAALADMVRADADLRGVLDLLVGKPDYDLASELTKLVKDEAVPYLAAHRYKDSGMRKRAVWEEVWDLQRREDAGEKVEIPVPPKYSSADFKTTAYWRNRGKLDVPKERFILYPGAGREGDKTPVLGWAGWDHLHQAQALARIVLDRQQVDGWGSDRIEPLLAGLVELEPWLGQWHNEYDAAYGGSPADFYRAFLDDQLHTHGLTRDKVKGWRP